MKLSFHNGRAIPAPSVIGLGASATASSIAAVASQGAAVTGGLLGGLSALGALSPAFAIAGPIGAAVAGLTAIAIAIASQFKGCGQTCIEATTIVNNIEPILLQNLGAYLAAPVHYASLQAAAINNFNIAWNGVLAACGPSANLGTAGQKCISDRAQGSCAYKTSPGGWGQNNGTWTYNEPGANGSGSTCWNWFVGYLDPITSDPSVVPDPVGSSASFNSAGQEVVTSTGTPSATGAVSSTSSILPWLFAFAIGYFAVTEL